jgi:hypothetical protein
MAATPEMERGEVSQIQEVNTEAEFPVFEAGQSSGVKVIQKTFKSQVSDDSGKPIIQTPPTQVITIQPPGDQATLVKQSKGSTTDSKTWLGAIWLRILKQALHFGWKIISGESQK